MCRWTGVLIAGCAVVGLLAVGAVAGSGALIVDEAIEMPEETIEAFGVELTVDSVLVLEEGESVTAVVTAGNDPEVRVEVRDSDTGLVATPWIEDDGQVTIDTTGYSPGSYAVLLEIDGHYQDIQPLIVEGYTLAPTGPAGVNESQMFFIQTTVEPTALSEQPEQVEIGLWRENETHRFDAAEVESGVYEAEIDSDQLSGGTYSVEAVALGDDVNGEREPLGLNGSLDIAVYPDDVVHLAAYTNAEEVIDTSGLRAAITDWVHGDIDTATLREVISIWVTGDSVV